MKPAGILVAFAGYTLAYFGWCSLRGPGVGLVDLVIPGRFDAKGLTIPGSSAAAGGAWVGPPQTGTAGSGPLPAAKPPAPKAKPLGSLYG
jgi:hypothetical protein